MKPAKADIASKPGWHFPGDEFRHPRWQSPFKQLQHRKHPRDGLKRLLEEVDDNPDHFQNGIISLCYGFSDLLKSFDLLWGEFEI